MRRTYIRMGEKVVRIRQPDRNDDAARRVDPEKGRAPRHRPMNRNMSRSYNRKLVGRRQL